MKTISELYASADRVTRFTTAFVLIAKSIAVLGRISTAQKVDPYGKGEVDPLETRKRTLIYHMKRLTAEMRDHREHICLDEISDILCVRYNLRREGFDAIVNWGSEEKTEKVKRV